MAKKETNVASVLGLVAKADLTEIELFTSPNPKEVQEKAENSSMQLRMVGREGRVAMFVGLDGLNVELLKALDTNGFNMVKREAMVDHRGMPKIPKTRANNSEDQKMVLGKQLAELHKNGRNWTELSKQFDMAVSTCHRYVDLYQNSGHKGAKATKTPKIDRVSVKPHLPKIKKMVKSGKTWPQIEKSLGIPKKKLQQCFYSETYLRRKKRKAKR